jgi:hypothetical protein
LLFHAGAALFVTGDDPGDGDGITAPKQDQVIEEVIEVVNVPPFRIS